jgi:hypothetical protein
VTRTIVISDAHGQPLYIQQALEEADYVKGVDRLIYAGDYIDIGPSPELCFDLLRKNDAEILWGNHELAILLGYQIHPQDSISWRFREFFAAMVYEWKVATVVDDILVAHAGYGEFYRPLLNKCGGRLEDVVARENEDFTHILNSEMVKLQFWDTQLSPLWYRPYPYAPLAGITQVVGHTPPFGIPKQVHDMCTYLTVDPYMPPEEWWGDTDYPKGRWRYAVIEDGDVTIHDSQDWFVCV